MTLTREAILAMTAAELRLAVAEHIDGWKWHGGDNGFKYFRKDEDFNYAFVKCNDAIVYSSTENIPNYTADIAAAWSVLEKMQGGRGDTYEAFVNMTGSMCSLVLMTRAEVCNVICRAALIAIMSETA